MNIPYLMFLNLIQMPSYGTWWILFIACATLFAFAGHVPLMILGHLGMIYLVYIIDMSFDHSISRVSGPGYDFDMTFFIGVLIRTFYVNLLTVPFSVAAIGMRKQLGVWFPYWWNRTQSEASA